MMRMKNDVKNFRGDMLSLDKERQINYISKDGAIIKRAMSLIKEV
jgi:hypothetical protein